MAAMSFIEELSAVVLLVDFLLGVTFGVVGSAAFGSVREDQEYSLLGTALGPVSAGARVIYGVYTSSDEYMRSLLARGAETTIADERGDKVGGTEGQESRQ
jgi:hypothetical protein